MNGDPEHFFIDVGYRDPTDDDFPPPERDLPSADDVELDPPGRLPAPAIAELGREQLERELAFGAGVRQVLVRDELLRRAGDGYQPSLFAPYVARGR